MSCKKSKEEVDWVLSKDFIKYIKKSLNTSDVEIAGKILFENNKDCTKDICNKTSSVYTSGEGDNSSVSTPHGIINFHTHPKICYDDVHQQEQPLC